MICNSYLTEYVSEHGHGMGIELLLMRTCATCAFEFHLIDCGHNRSSEMFHFPECSSINATPFSPNAFNVRTASMADVLRAASIGIPPLRQYVCHYPMRFLCAVSASVDHTTSDGLRLRLASECGAPNDLEFSSDVKWKSAKPHFCSAATRANYRNCCGCTA